jgi:putative radical SAM enzyme (TIGR03279 family)
MSGIVKSIDKGSVADLAGLREGDMIIAINGHVLRDVIDAQFYGADEDLTFRVSRDGDDFEVRARRDFGQALGVEFEHPTFDIDIRRCNNLCPFCFVLQNAPRMRRALYIKDDDYRYSFLFGHFVTLTNLSDEDWQRIAEQRLTPLYVSVHATDLQTRRACLRNENAPDIMAQLRWLTNHGIDIHTQLVITPGLNDGARLEESVRELATLHPHVMTVSVVPVGLTRHHKYGFRPHSREEANRVLGDVHRWQTEFQTTLGTRFVFATDEWYLVIDRAIPPKKYYEGWQLEENGQGMVRAFLDEWRRLKKSEIREWTSASHSPLSNLKFSEATLVSASLFAPTLKKTADEFSRMTQIPTNVVSVVNKKLGDTITVAGLLCGEDVIRSLTTPDQSPIVNHQSPIVILPRLMFDHPNGVALDDVSPLEIARAIGKPIALADWMGDVVDALTGNNRLMFAPDADPLSVPIVREGGWAVEKYL